MADPRFTDKRLINAKREIWRQVEMLTLDAYRQSNLRGQGRSVTNSSTLAVAAQANTDVLSSDDSNSKPEKPASIFPSIAVPDNASDGSQLNTFEYFPKLPPEVQLEIWKTAAAEGQVIKIDEKVVVFDLFADPTSLPQQVRGTIVEGGYPAIIHACHASRKEGLKIYKLCLRSIFKHPIYFATHLDTVRVMAHDGDVKKMKGGWDGICKELLNFISYGPRLAYKQKQLREEEHLAGTAEQRNIARLAEWLASPIPRTPSHPVRKTKKTHINTEE